MCKVNGEQGTDIDNMMHDTDRQKSYYTGSKSSIKTAIRLNNAAKRHINRILCIFRNKALLLAGIVSQKSTSYLTGPRFMPLRT